MVSRRWEIQECLEKLQGSRAVDSSPLPSPSVPPPPAPLPLRATHTLFSPARSPSSPFTPCNFILYVSARWPVSSNSLCPMAWVKSHYSIFSENPKLSLTLFTTWNYDSVNFPNCSTVHSTRQGISWFQISHLLGLVPAQGEGAGRELFVE